MATTTGRSQTSHPISYYWNMVKDMDKEIYTPEEAYELTMKDIKEIYDRKDAV
jgi:archaellum component FlaC